MKRILSLILAFILCLSLCACEGNAQEPQYGGESTIGENSNGGNTNNTTHQVNAEYIAMVCGRWELISGWNNLGYVLEFREGGICVFNEEELNGMRHSKISNGLMSPRSSSIFTEMMNSYTKRTSILHLMEQLCL